MQKKLVHRKENFPYRTAQQKQEYNKQYHIDHFEEIMKRKNSLRDYAKDREDKRVRNYNRRTQVFDILGGPICKRCGFTDRRALQIDHINGGGQKEVKALGGNRNFERRITKMFPEDAKKLYQVLCANCNWIKRAENKEAVRPIKYETNPHIQPISVETFGQIERADSCMSQGY